MVSIVQGLMADSAPASPRLHRLLGGASPVHQCAALLLANSLLQAMAGALHSPALQDLMVGLQPDACPPLQLAAGGLKLDPQHGSLPFSACNDVAAQQALLESQQQLDVAGWTEQLCQVLSTVSEWRQRQARSGTCSIKNA